MLGADENQISSLIQAVLFVYYGLYINAILIKVSKICLHNMSISK